MPGYDQKSISAIQPELTFGESILWSGQPKAGVIFHRDDFLLVPFSLLWGGFAIFWEAGVSGHWGFAKSSNPWTFGVLWGIPFVLAGQYLIWGRFLHAAWLKSRTYYAVTDKRVIAVQDSWSRKVAASYIDSLPTLIKEARANGIGILRFAPAPPIWSTSRGRGSQWAAWNGMSVGDMPTFMDIAEVDYVYSLISGQREKLKTPKSTF